MNHNTQRKARCMMMMCLDTVGQNPFSRTCSSRQYIIYNITCLREADLFQLANVLTNTVFDSNTPLLRLSYFPPKTYGVLVEAFMQVLKTKLRARGLMVQG